MTREISKDDVLSIIGGAFAPLECSAESKDNGNRVNFRVFDDDGAPLLNVKDILMQRIQTIEGMKSIIWKSRNSLIERGYNLQPWQFPNAKSS